MIGILEIVVILFSLFALSRVFLRLREKQISLGQFVFWAVIWIAVIVLVLLQERLGLFARYLESRRPVDVLIYLSILLLFYLIFRLYVKLDKLNSAITTLSRQEALTGLKKRRR